MAAGPTPPDSATPGTPPSASRTSGAGEGDRGSRRRQLAVGRQRRVWNLRARDWAHHVDDNEGLRRVVDAVVSKAHELRGDKLGDVVDLGTGSGQVVLALAADASSALAVDVSAAMLQQLQERARQQGIDGVQTKLSPIESLRLPPASVDLVVSNYALHHLRDRDKGAVLAEVLRWLRPGGHLVFGDMMLGRGADAADRAVIASKVRQLARKGPGGWWRIAKNAARMTLRVHERPLSAAAWQALATRQGYVDVAVHSVVQEAAVLVARAPGALTATDAPTPPPAGDAPRGS